MKRPKPVIRNPVTEALVITAEECAEATKEITKALRFGLEHYGPMRELSARITLARECGQLQAMINILRHAGVLDDEDLAAGEAEKYAKLRKWSRLPTKWLRP